MDVANIKTQTNAYIGDSNTIDTKGDVSASAKDEVTLNSHAYAASIGAVGLSGSISVYSIGSASFDDKDGILTGKNAAPHYRLALVRVDPRGAVHDELRYLDDPFATTTFGDFDATGLRGDWAKMWTRGKEPF